MKAKITIYNSLYNITDVDLIPNINITDVMNGNPDTISFSFIFENDIVDKTLMKQKCKIDIYSDDNYETPYKTYNMAISEISCEKNSMYSDNGYYYTVKIKEHTIYLKDCIRTDLKISPALYKVDIYPTLKEALFKIIDVHNIPLLNEKITDADEEILEKLGNIACNTLIYKDLSTFDQISDIFDRIGYVPYLENGYLTGFPKQGGRDVTQELTNIVNISSYSSSRVEGNNYDVISTKSYNTLFDVENQFTPYTFKYYKDNFYEPHFVTIPYSGGTPNATKIKEYFLTRYKHWVTGIEDEFEGELSGVYTARPLFIKDFNTEAEGVEETRNYYIELPTNIENIQQVYAVRPNFRYFNYEESGDYFTDCDFGWDFDTLDIENLVEYSVWQNLNGTYKRQTAYYKRGENKIYNVIALVGAGNPYLLNNALPWSDGELFNILKKSFFAVEYKPMSTQQYTNYDYTSCIDDDKPSSVQNINLPYKQVSDKQISNIMSYELQRKTDTSYLMKFMTDDLSILNLKASDIIKINDMVLIINEMNIVLSNNTIEVSFELNKKVVSNSMVSNYSDNVRVSTNLATETTVTRDLPIFKENILFLNDRVVEDSEISDYEMPNYEKELCMSGLNNIGINSFDPESNLDILKDLEEQYVDFKYSYNDGTDWGGKILVYYTDGYLMNSLTSITFPIYARRVYSPETSSDYFVSPDDTEQEITTFQELQSFVSNDDVGVYKDFGEGIFGQYLRTTRVAYSFYYTSGHPLDGTDYKILDLGIFALPFYTTKSNKIKYSLFETAAQEVRNYDKIVSNSGNIMTIAYKFNNPNFVNCYYPTDKMDTQLNTYSISSSLGYDIIEIDDTDIDSATPIYYNTTENNVKIFNVGDIDLTTYFYYFSGFQYGLTLDLGEIINPYIQYTTISTKDKLDLNCEITELNNNVEWLSIESIGVAFATYKLSLYKVKEGLSMHSLNLGQYIDDDLIHQDITEKYGYLSSANYTTSYLPISILTSYDTDFTTLKTIEYEEGCEYVIVKEEIANPTNRVPLIKFKVKKDIDTLYLHSYIVSSN